MTRTFVTVKFVGLAMVLECLFQVINLIGTRELISRPKRPNNGQPSEPVRSMSGTTLRGNPSGTSPLTKAP